MCLYDPPLFLGTPDLSAAGICALPLAASATRWSEVLAAFVGLAVAFLAAHTFMVACHHEVPPSLFYRAGEQGSVIPASLAYLAYILTLLFAVSSFVRGLWRANYAWAAGHLVLALALIAATIGLFAYFTEAARASMPELLTKAAAQPGAGAQEEIVIIDCVAPPFGEGMPGYFMLAVLVIFQILVAVGIGNAIKRKLAPS